MKAVQARIRAAFRDAGVTGWLHARDLDGTELEVGADTPVVMSSVFKVPLLVTLYRQADAGLLDVTDLLTVRPGERSAGPTGTAAMQDPVTLSIRDLAYLMIAVSDNAAADVLAERTGLTSVNAVLAELDLPATRVVHLCRDLYTTMAADAGGTGTDLPALLAEPGVLARLRVLDPARTNRTTPREATALLAGIWRDEVASAGSCAAIRRLLGLQVWPHRLASGFPFDDVRVSGKTGTLPTLRNEIGVVEYPDGGRYAVAVFTRAASTALTLPAADAVIGTAARLAVDALRG